MPSPPLLCPSLLSDPLFDLVTRHFQSTRGLNHGLLLWGGEVGENVALYLTRIGEGRGSEKAEGVREGEVRQGQHQKGAGVGSDLVRVPGLRSPNPHTQARHVSCLERVHDGFDAVVPTGGEGEEGREREGRGVGRGVVCVPKPPRTAILVALKGRGESERPAFSYLVGV